MVSHLLIDWMKEVEIKLVGFSCSVSAGHRQRLFPKIHIMVLDIFDVNSDPDSRSVLGPFEKREIPADH